MGIWDFINSTTAILKRNAPDLVNGLQKVNQYMPNDEARAKIALFVTKLGKNAADYAVKEGVKSIPGGIAVTKIISQTINDMKSENFEEQEMKARQEAIGKPKNEAGGCQQLPNQAEMFKQNVEFSSQKAPYSDSSAVHEPEDLFKNDQDV